MSAAAAFLRDPRATWLLVGLGALTAVAALVVAARLLIEWRARAAIMERLAPRGERRGAHGAREEAARLLVPAAAPWRQRLADGLDAWMPAALTSAQVADRLSRAGMHAPDAPALFGLVRLLAVPTALLLAVPLIGAHAASPTLALPIALVVGVMGPTAVLDRLIARRQAAIRASLPDALDLLVVCMEAGVGLDAGMLRVARELEPVHPALSEELTVVNRRVGAGLPRDEAMRAMFARTGIEELRSLATTMVQAERLGTSLGRVLRIHADGLRVKRRQHAAGRAAEASVKMILPLVTLLLPAFFAVVLGPAALSLLGAFDKP